MYFMAPPSVSCPSGHSPGRRRTTPDLYSCRRSLSGAETAQELIEQVGLVVEVVRQYAARAVCLAGDGPDRGLRDPVARDNPPGRRQNLVPPGIPIHNLWHVFWYLMEEGATWGSTTEESDVRLRLF